MIGHFNIEDMETVQKKLSDTLYNANLLVGSVGQEVSGSLQDKLRFRLNQLEETAKTQNSNNTQTRSDSDLKTPFVFKCLDTLSVLQITLQDLIPWKGRLSTIDPTICPFK